MRSNTRTKGYIYCTFFILTLFHYGFPQRLPIEKINLRDGFSLSIYAENVENARSMALGHDGTLFVGTRKAGKIYALQDLNRDFRADKLYEIANGLNMPNGVAFKNDSLYVAEVNRVLRFDNIKSNLENPPEPVIIYDNYPEDKWHGWKFIRFGPDEKLYIPVGAPCNVCEKVNQRYATITRMNPDGSNVEIFAHGVRNSVGFDWHPVTGELWFTDNGRDRLGDDIPPDELNRAPVRGLHFGFPYCHGMSILDPKFGKKRNCNEFQPPEMELGPHVAALGMRFYTGEMFPNEFKNQIFIAEHGSWNRSIPIGYRITLVRIKNNNAVSYEVFADGWLQDGKAWGRPVDVLMMPDGSILISDDLAGAIYRVSYSG